MQRSITHSQYQQSSPLDTLKFYLQRHWERCPSLLILGVGVFSTTLISFGWLSTQSKMNTSADIINAIDINYTGSTDINTIQNKSSPFELVSSSTESNLQIIESAKVKIGEVDALSPVTDDKYRIGVTELPKVFTYSVPDISYPASALAQGFNALASVDDTNLINWSMDMLLTDIERPEQHLALSALLHDWATVDLQNPIIQLLQSMHSSRSEMDLTIRKEILSQLLFNRPDGYAYLHSLLEDTNLTKVQQSAAQQTLIALQPEHAHSIADQILALNDAATTEIMISDWIYTDANAALSWLETAAGSSLPKHLTDQALATLVEQDPVAALARAESMTPGQGRVASIEYALLSLLENEPDTVRDYIDSLPNTRDGRILANKLALSIASEYGSNDPLAALNWAQLKEPTMAQSLVEAILVEWYADDSASAISWATTNLDSTARTLVIEHGLSEQLTNDPKSGKQAYIELDMSTRMQLASKFGEQLESEYPGAGLDWLQTISDPAERNEAQQGILQAVVVTDPESAVELSMDFDSIRQTEILIDLVDIHGDNRPELFQQFIDDPRIDSNTRAELQRWHSERQPG